MHWRAKENFAAVFCAVHWTMSTEKETAFTSSDEPLEALCIHISFLPSPTRYCSRYLFSSSHPHLSCLLKDIDSTTSDLSIHHTHTHCPPPSFPALVHHVQCKAATTCTPHPHPHPHPVTPSCPLPADNSLGCSDDGMSTRKSTRRILQMCRQQVISDVRWSNWPLSR